VVDAQERSAATAVPVRPPAQGYVDATVLVRRDVGCGHLRGPLDEEVGKAAVLLEDSLDDEADKLGRERGPHQGTRH